mmetsp:Transcript_16307/g.34984  ORF Transcript_16307/g.34984 Transcript_16307/m.34984 type:complete len:884 (+) Transcript_16307:315-2966(+)
MVQKRGRFGVITGGTVRRNCSGNGHFTRSIALLYNADNLSQNSVSSIALSAYKQRRGEVMRAESNVHFVREQPVLSHARHVHLAPRPCKTHLASVSIPKAKEAGEQEAMEGSVLRNTGPVLGGVLGKRTLKRLSKCASKPTVESAQVPGASKSSKASKRAVRNAEKARASPKREQSGIHIGGSGGVGGCAVNRNVDAGLDSDGGDEDADKTVHVQSTVWTAHAGSRYFPLYSDSASARNARAHFIRNAPVRDKPRYLSIIDLHKARRSEGSRMSVKLDVRSCLAELEQMHSDPFACEIEPDFNEVRSHIVSREVVVLHRQRAIERESQSSAMHLAMRSFCRPVPAELLRRMRQQQQRPSGMLHIHNEVSIERTGRTEMRDRITDDAVIADSDNVIGADTDDAIRLAVLNLHHGVASQVDTCEVCFDEFEKVLSISSANDIISAKATRVLAPYADDTADATTTSTASATDMDAMTCAMTVATVVEADGCHHTMCTVCLRRYVAAALSNGVHAIKCPNPYCTCLFSDETLRTALDREAFERLQQLRDDAFVVANPRLVFCPRPNCGHVVERQGGRAVALSQLPGLQAARQRLAQQPRRGAHAHAPPCTQQAHLPCVCDCGEAWCHLCLQPSHWPASCQATQRFIARHGALSVELGETAMSLKKCPACKVPIEKLGGCDHMRCTMCNVDFCWACGNSNAGRPGQSWHGIGNPCVPSLWHRRLAPLSNDEILCAADAETLRSVLQLQEMVATTNEDLALLTRVAAHEPFSATFSLRNAGYYFARKVSYSAAARALRAKADAARVLMHYQLMLVSTQGDANRKQVVEWIGVDMRKLESVLLSLGAMFERDRLRPPSRASSRDLNCTASSLASILSALADKFAEGQSGA